MLINFKTRAAKTEQQNFVIEIKERLPEYINIPCTVQGHFGLESVDNYCVMALTVNAELIITCQRCLNEFNYNYNSLTELALCPSEEIAEKLMERYECIVPQGNQVDLKELLTDELYLYAPKFHLERSDCNEEMKKFIRLEAE
ncbi:YceD family protein [Legionella fairfieldensis]|uniref:YceD family protein n=1 Tax=Legionella fairfieldensis TaxID=45064 RepID=UPI00049051A8|nr:YceD family protein [Legionella fairfieldensis]